MGADSTTKEEEDFIRGMGVFEFTRYMRREYGVHLRFGTRGRVILEAMLRDCPEPVHTDRLMQLLWGERADGGPINPQANIAVAVTALRSQVAESRYSVENYWGFGYSIEVDAPPPKDKRRLGRPPGGG